MSYEMPTREAVYAAWLRVRDLERELERAKAEGLHVSLGDPLTVHQNKRLISA